MYVVHIADLGHWVFTVDDPRDDGFAGPIAQATLAFPDGIDNPGELYHWPRGADAPETCLGRDPDNPSRYMVFRSDTSCRAAGFAPLGPNFTVHGSWSEVAKFLAEPARTV